MGSGVSGRRTGVTERLHQSDATLAERNVQYTYDQLNRLTQETSGYEVPPSGGPAPGHEFTTDYIYYLVGNRLAKNTTGETIAYQFNNNDQLTTEISSLDGQTDYGYSNNGEMTSKVSADANYAYNYNLDGRLSGATITRQENGHTVNIASTYRYDQSGIRTRATSTTQINSQPGYATDRVFLVDSANHTGYAQVLEELDGSNPTPVKSYVLGDDVLADSGKYLLYDGHGSTRALVDASGAITDRYSFDAYGVMLGGQPNVTNPVSTDLTYSGEQFDTGLQQQYLRARYMDPSSGRFNRVDPFSGSSTVPQSLHKYAYAHGDPIMEIDPSGMAAGGLIENLGVATIHNIMATLLLGTVAGLGFGIAEGDLGLGFWSFFSVAKIGLAVQILLVKFTATRNPGLLISSLFAGFAGAVTELVPALFSTDSWARISARVLNGFADGFLLAAALGAALSSTTLVNGVSGFFQNFLLKLPFAIRNAILTKAVAIMTTAGIAVSVSTGAALMNETIDGITNENGGFELGNLAITALIASVLAVVGAPNVKGGISETDANLLSFSLTTIQKNWNDISPSLVELARSIWSLL